MTDKAFMPDLCKKSPVAVQQQFHDTDIFDNGISYGRYLYFIRHS